MKIFISHQAEDGDIAQKIRDFFIELFPGGEIFLAISGNSIIAGKRYVSTITDSIQEAELFILIIGRKTSRTFWPPFEMGVASCKKGRSIVLVSIKRKQTQRLPLPLEERQILNISDHKELQILVNQLKDKLTCQLAISSHDVPRRCKEVARYINNIRRRRLAKRMALTISVLIFVAALICYLIPHIPVRDPLVMVGSGTVYGFLRDSEVRGIPKSSGSWKTESGETVLVLDCASQAGVDVTIHSFFQGTSPSFIDTTPIVAMSAADRDLQGIAGNVAAVTLKACDPMKAFVSAKSTSELDEMEKEVKNGAVKVETVNKWIKNGAAIYIPGSGSATQSVAKDIGLDYTNGKGWNLNMELLVKERTDSGESKTAVGIGAHPKIGNIANWRAWNLEAKDGKLVQRPMNLYFRITDDGQAHPRVCKLLYSILSDLKTKNLDEANIYLEAISFGENSCHLKMPPWVTNGHLWNLSNPSIINRDCVIQK